MPTVLHARPFDTAALAPFATVLKARDGKANVFPEMTAHGDVAGAHTFTILCPNPVEGDVVITALERHPHSTQSFVPIRAGRWLVLVAPKAADGGPDLSAALVFVAGPEDAICINQDVWHAGLTVFDRPAQFGMIMWKARDVADGIVCTLQDKIKVVL